MSRRPVNAFVEVRGNDVDRAIKILKKKMQREGTLKELKLKRHFEKPSEKRKREERESIRRIRKGQLKKIQREHGVDKASAKLILQGKSPR